MAQRAALWQHGFASWLWIYKLWPWKSCPSYISLGFLIYTLGKYFIHTQVFSKPLICASVQFGHSVVSDSLQTHGLQHARLPCPSPTPRARSNSCPLSWWCHPTISSSVVPFSFNLSQHQGLFKRVSSSNQVAKVLERQLQHQSFQWMFRSDFF